MEDQRAVRGLDQLHGMACDRDSGELTACCHWSFCADQGETWPGGLTIVLDGLLIRATLILLAVFAVVVSFTSLLRGK